MKQNGFTDKLKETSPVPERISPENVEKMLYENKRSSISIRRRVISAAAAIAVIIGGTAGLLYKNGFFDSKKSTAIKTSSSQASQNSSVSHNSSPDDKSSDTPQPKTEEHKLKGMSVLSYDELNDYIGEYYQKNQNTYYNMDKDRNTANNDEAIAEDAETNNASDMTTAAAGMKDTASDHSETYTQENGVDEADIVKTDGNNIFYLCRGHIFAVGCEDGKMDEHMIDFGDIFGESFMNSYANEMYLDSGTLTVIINSYEPYVYTCYDEDYEEGIKERTLDQDSVNVITFDVTDLDNIRQTGKYTIQGYYNSSRMIDGKLYLTSNSFMNYYNTYKESGKPEFVPIYTVNGEEHHINADDIYVPDNCKDMGYVNLSLIDTKKKCEPVSIKTFLGRADEIYQTKDKIFILSNIYENSSDEVSYSWSWKTNIISVDTKDSKLIPIASGAIEGTVKDKYSLYYNDGILSAAVNYTNYSSDDDEPIQKNYLYTLNDNLEVLGKTGSFGNGEEIKSVTYKDGYAYIVTFMQTDPLFAIDLHDPKNPVIVSELKMPGFSTHMRPFTDGRIVGFGYTADEETGRTTGLKLSVYDNSDPDNVKELDKVEITENSDEYSDIYISSAGAYDVKALLIDPDKNIIAFPYCEICYNYDDETYAVNKSKYESGYRFYSYDDKNGLVFKGEYKTKDEINGDNYYSYNMNDFVRAAYIGNVYYLFYDCGIISLDMEGMNVIEDKDLSSIFKVDTDYSGLPEYTIVD